MKSAGVDEREGVVRVMDLRGTYKGGGGPDKTVLNSAARHDPGKVRVLVTYLRQPWDREFSIPDQARRLGIDYVDVEDRSLVDLACLRRLAALLDEHGLGVLHAHDDKTLLYGWLLRVARPGLRILCTCHSHAALRREDFPSLHAFLTFKARQRAVTFLMKRFLKPVLTVSADTKRRLVASGLLVSDEVAVLANGIDTAVWSRQHGKPALRRELGVPEGGFLVGTVARITPDKDLPTFYRTAAEVLRLLPGTKFAVVGDGYGDELEQARREVRRLGLEGAVHFTGHRTDLADIYASFDVFVMTSRTEGMPNTLLEAMAMGVPVVATGVGGIPELLEHGEGGYVALPGAAGEIAAHVVTLLRSTQLRERFGASCRLRVERHFGFEDRVRLLEAYYAWFAGSGPLPAEAAGRGSR